MLKDEDPPPSPILHHARSRHEEAVSAGAIAARWRCDPSSCRAPWHKPFHGKLFFFKESWATSRKLLNKHRINTVDIEKYSYLEPHCGCDFQYLFALEDVEYFYLSDLGKHYFETAQARSRGITDPDGNSSMTGGRRQGFAFFRRLAAIVDRRLHLPTLDPGLDGLAPVPISQEVD